MKKAISAMELDLYEHIYKELITYYKPEGIMEYALVERITYSLVKLYRSAKGEGEHVQTNLKFTYIGGVDGSATTLWDLVYKSSEILLNIYTRYDITIENRLYRAMHELERLQRIRLGENISAPITMDISQMGSFSKNE